MCIPKMLALGEYATVKGTPSQKDADHPAADRNHPRLRLPLPWPIAALFAVALAPRSLMIAAYERRSEGRLARQREALRSEGRFEEAAVQKGSGAFYFLGTVWAGSYWH